MSSITPNLPDLEKSFTAANQILAQKGEKYTVSGKNTDPKKPVFLELTYPDKTIKKIGITHLAHLKGANWDDLPFEKIARTTDEVTQSILARITLFLESQEKGLYIHPKYGAIFDFGKEKVEIHTDDTFSVNGKIVTHSEKNLLIGQIVGEDIIRFQKMDNGHIHLLDTIDQREGKGMFLDLEGRLYRE